MGVAILGAKFKIVSGYPGGNDVTLAMERGEVKGRCGWSWSSVVATHKRWIDDKSITVLVQLSLNKHPDLPDVPLIMDFAKGEDQQQMFKLIFARQVMGRPYLAPPGVPADRADALRKAFMQGGDTTAPVLMLNWPLWNGHSITSPSMKPSDSRPGPWVQLSSMT